MGMLALCTKCGGLSVKRDRDSEHPGVGTCAVCGPTYIDDKPRNWHSIIGPNGMCECGVRADGTVVHCSDLLKAEKEDARPKTT